MSDFNYTVSSKDQGLTQIFLEQAKKQKGFDAGKKINWNNVMNIFDEIQKEEQAQGQKLFSGGTDKTARGWGSSYVIKAGDEIKLSESQMNKIYKAMGLELSDNSSSHQTVSSPAQASPAVVSKPTAPTETHPNVTSQANSVISNNSSVQTPLQSIRKVFDNKIKQIHTDGLAGRVVVNSETVTEKNPKGNSYTTFYDAGNNPIYRIKTSYDGQYEEYTYYGEDRKPVAGYSLDKDGMKSFKFENDSKIEKEYTKTGQINKETTFKIGVGGDENIFTVTSYNGNKSRTSIDEDGDGYEDVYIVREYGADGKVTKETPTRLEDINKLKNPKPGTIVPRYMIENRKMENIYSGVMIK